MTHFDYKHIIWDWNGTLFDDARLCIELMNGMLSRRRLPALSPARYETIFGFPVIDYYQKVGFDFAAEPFERLSDEFITGYRSRVEGEAGDAPILRAGAREVLERGQQRGLTQSILSAMEQTQLDRLVARFRLQGYFSDVVGVDDHHAFGKTEVGLRWIAAQDVPTSAMLFVGDTLHDVKVAQALGVDCCLVYSGHHARARLETADVKIIDSLAELYPLGPG